MTHAGSISLVRAAGFGPLPDLLEQRAGSRTLSHVFDKIGIPIAVREAQATPVPLIAMMQIFSESARLLGDRTFGLEVGRGMSHRSYGLWAEYSGQGATLGAALLRTSTSSWAHQRRAWIELVPVGAHWVWRFVTPPAPVRKAEHSDHVIWPMIDFVRVYLGRDWRPDWVEVNYPRDPDAHLVEERLGVPMLFEQPGVGLAIGSGDLSRGRVAEPWDPRRTLTLRDLYEDVVLRRAPEPARSLSAVVSLRLLDGRTDIEGAARLVGLSVQGLQRRLRQKGYTYREVLDAVRLERAKSLLRETRMPILDIALDLGYEDHCNFTRAFARWSDCTPSEYRRGADGSSAPAT